MQRYNRRFERDSSNLKMYLIIIGIVLAIVVSALFFLMETEGGCGDGVCGPEENSINCALDCEPECGNGVCESGENYGNCESDCDSGSSNNYCDGEEDGICDPDCELFQDPDCEPVCGNDKCEEGEDCYECAYDCSCSSDEYCSPEEEKCVKPDCGNEVCEPMEDPSNCCLDCECTLPGQVCNTDTKKCEKLSFDISDSDGRNLVKEYHESQGNNVLNVEMLGYTEFGGKLMKKYRVNLEGKQWPIFVGVTEDGNVVELPTT